MQDEPNKTILLVEDEDHIRDIIKILLKMEGYEIIEATDGRYALDIVQETIPDLVITDVMMPRMDGIQFFLALKESERTSSIPVIVLTVRSQPEDFKYASLLGVDEYITKPFNPQDLVRKVKKILNSL